MFVAAIGTLVGSQIADLLENSEDVHHRHRRRRSTTRSARTSTPQEVIDDFNDPDGAVQEFIRDQQDNAVRLSVAALGGLLQLFSVLLFTFYLVADGPKMRRAICSRLTPGAPGARAARRGSWPATRPAATSTRRALLALLSAVFHWIVFQSLGTPAPVALALWVGIVSQFLPVVGTYLAGVLPVLLTFLDSPLKALIVLDRHRRVPADRELPVLAAHHGPHDGAAPGAGVRRRARRRGRARRGRCRAGAAGGGDGARRCSPTGATATRSSRATSPRSATTGSGSDGRRSASRGA